MVERRFVNHRESVRAEVQALQVAEVDERFGGNSAEMIRSEYDLLDALETGECRRVDGRDVIVRQVKYFETFQFAEHVRTKFRQKILLENQRLETL